MNSMPFRQLKSFFKILIGVQYHCIAIHPGMPAEYPQKRQLFRQTAAFTWVRVCRLYQNKKGARRLLFTQCGNGETATTPLTQGKHVISR